MSNTFFQFKQFIVHQDNTAMKVCTDACFLGAWAANKMSMAPIHNVLDIGCGSGLLSLMLAQKIDASIDAVEFDVHAAEQAKENVELSPWKTKIKVVASDINLYAKEKLYDLVICNPPFYEGDLRSPDEKKNAAMHDSKLTFQSLIKNINERLNEEGAAIILMPASRIDDILRLVSDHTLFIRQKIFLKQTPSHDPFRCITIIDRKGSQQEDDEEHCIHDENRNYSQAFRELLKDYYLNF